MSVKTPVMCSIEQMVFTRKKYSNLLLLAGVWIHARLVERTTTGSPITCSDARDQSLRSGGEWAAGFGREMVAAYK